MKESSTMDLHENQLRLEKKRPSTEAGKQVQPLAAKLAKQVERNDGQSRNELVQAYKASATSERL
jgi:hypothetical protein